MCDASSMLMHTSLRDSAGRNMARYLSWLEHMVHTHGVEGSTPPLAILDEITSRGILAQLGEHLPYKQRVIGSSPIGPIFHRRH